MMECSILGSFLNLRRTLFQIAQRVFAQVSFNAQEQPRLDKAMVESDKSH